MKRIYTLLIVCFSFSGQYVRAQACTGTPASNAALATSTAFCAGTNATLSLQNAYTQTGIVYQWAYSTASAFGPWTAINGANSPTLATTTLTDAAFYTAVIGCTNSFLSTTATAVYVNIMTPGATTTVPYFESFETPISNGLPNCSWSASSLGTNCLSFSTSIANAVVYSGTHMLGFSYSLSALGTHEFYSQGMSLQSSIIYSVGVHQSANNYASANNWSTFGLGVGPSQSVTNGTVVYSTSSPGIGPYAARGNTFTVPSTGIYYVRLFATSVSGSSIAQYLTFDNLSVTVPCSISPNSATVSLASSLICSAPIVTVNLLPALNCTVAGGNTFTLNPPAALPFATFTVLVTNTLTGCTDVNNVNITIANTPTLIVLTPLPEICQKSSISITAIGANSFTLLPNNFVFANAVSVSPTAATNYTIVGVNAAGCSNTKTITINVNPEPTLVLSPPTATICKGETFSVTASGASVYNVGTNFYTGVINFPALTSDSNFQIVGTDTKGCMDTINYLVKVSDCLGINTLSKDADFIVFPNPNSGAFKIEVSQNASMKIRDVSGRLIYSSELKAGSNTIQQKDLSRGLYVIEVQTEKGLQKKQLIIE